MDGLPYLFNVPGLGHQIKGELYALPLLDMGLERLDRLEGHPRFYRREWVQVQDAAGNKVQAQTYFIASGKLGQGVKLHESFVIDSPHKRIMRELRRVPKSA